MRGQQWIKTAVLTIFLPIAMVPRASQAIPLQPWSQRNLSPPPLQQLMADVSPEGRRKIEAIYHDYEHRIAAFQKYLTKVQKDFKKHLREDSDEEIIRKAFNPIAAAMEDLAVHQIMMIQEIKRVISSQLKAGREEQQALLSRNGTDDPHRPPLRSATQSQERGR